MVPSAAAAGPSLRSWWISRRRSGNASWNTAMKPMTLSRPLTWTPGAVISASAAQGSASLLRSLNASMCLRITSLALGIGSPIIVGSAILSERDGGNWNHRSRSTLWHLSGTLAQPSGCRCVESGCVGVRHQEFPVPLGHDLQSFARDLDRALVVDCVRRGRDPGSPLLHLGQRRVVEALAIQVHAQSEIDQSEACARVRAHVAALGDELEVEVGIAVV